MKISSGTILVLVWITFSFLHIFFKKTWLYWYYDWLDIPMHLSGGFLVVYTWFFLQRNGYFKNILQIKLFQPMYILIAMMIGWEIYKYLIGDIVSKNYVGDTVLDLILGFVGGLIAYKWFSSRTIGK